MVIKKLQNIILKILQLFEIFLKKILLLLIYCIRPFLGATAICSFTVGCTEYALYQLNNESLVRSIFNITHRLLLCNPIAKFINYLLKY